MKLPTFVKTPKPTRFQYEPRYYDPVREDIEQRTERIRLEYEAENGKKGNVDYVPRIAFERNEKVDRKSSVFQLLLVIVLLGGAVAYFYLGNTGLYLTGGVLTLMVYLKTKGFL